MKYIFLIFILFSTEANAEKIVGNGGDAVVCRDNAKKIISAELLDYFEGRKERDLISNLDPRNTFAENIQTLINRSEVYDVSFKEKIANFYRDFFANAQFISGVDLVDIPDSHHISVPTGCAVEQLAIQNFNSIPGEKYYRINKDIWDKLDSVSQAGLVMHELLFKISLSGQPINLTDSRYVRYANSLLVSDKLKSISFMEYYRLLGSLNVGYMYYDGYIVNVRRGIFFTADGKVSEFVGIPMANQKTVKLWDGIEFSVDAQKSQYVHFKFDYLKNTLSVNVATDDNEFTYKNLIFSPYDYSAIGTKHYSLVFNLNTKKLISIGEISLQSKLEEKLRCKIINFYNANFSCENGVLNLGETSAISSNGYNYLNTNKTVYDYQLNILSAIFPDNSEVSFINNQVARILCSNDSAPLVKESYEYNYNYGNLRATYYGNEKPKVFSESADFSVKLGCRSQREIVFSKGTIPMSGVLAMDSGSHTREVFVFDKNAIISCGRRDKLIDAPIFTAYPSGFPKQAVFAFIRSDYFVDRTKFKMTNGRTIQLNLGDLVHFNEQGQIVEIEKNFCLDN